MSYNLQMAALQAAIDTVQPRDWRLDRVEEFVEQVAIPLRERAEFLSGELDLVRQKLAVEYQRLAIELGWRPN